MRLKILICLLLGAITLAVYWPARHFEMLNYDDQEFIDPEVSMELNWHGIERAMTEVVAANWHPVTLFSFLLMHELFGINPGAEHLLNVMFHAANAVLLFLVLVQMTEATWRSAIVAGMFAWHPLRVESVAWIAERKDVLFLFFMLLSLLCYARYAREVKEKGSEKGKASVTKSYWRPAGRLFYAGSLLFFILSFMSKAMVVTLPFLLLLLDFWPLQRLKGYSHGSSPLPSHRMREEREQQMDTSRASETHVPATGWTPVRQLVVEKIPFFALAILFSALTFWIQKTHAAVESLDYCGPSVRLENATLSYVMYLAKFFWPSKLALLYPYPRNFDSVEILLGGLLLLAISALCILQISRRPYLSVGWFWYLGTMMPVIGLVQVGVQAMADRYTYLPLIGPAISLVWLVSEWGRTKLLRNCLSVVAVVILAVCILLTRRQLPFWQNTASLFEHTIAVTPENGFAQFPLAVGLEEQGRWREAAVQFRIAIAMKPGAYNNLANFNLALLLAHKGYYREAAARFETALQLNPDFDQVLNALAWTLATCPDASIRDGKRAVQLGERACELTNYRVTLFIGTLAAAYAEAGRFDNAIAMAQRAIANAQKNGETGLVEKNQEFLKLYQQHKAYHE